MYKKYQLKNIHHIINVAIKNMYNVSIIIKIEYPQHLWNTLHLKIRYDFIFWVVQKMNKVSI